MQLTLVLPNLLDVVPARLDEAEAPGLSRLLTDATAPEVQPGGAIGVACGALGVQRQHDWPAAPWLARGAGIDVGARYWLRADPATIELGRDEGRLAGVVRDLSAAESETLLSRLRLHFAADGIEFVERGPGQWWVALDAPQAVETVPPDAAIGQPLAACLLKGADAARWQRWQSEIQMLLFEHPVNRSRAESGCAPVNFIWFWGGGTLQASPAVPSSSANPATAVLTQAPWLRDLARAAGAEVSEPPRSLAALAQARTSSTLVWLDDFDATDIRKQLAAFDADWASPLRRAVDRREVDLRLVLAGAGGALAFMPRPRSTWRRIRDRWSRAQPLSVLMPADA